MSGKTQTQSETSSPDVSALLLPVAGELLVVPSETVAEIIKPRPLQCESQAPSWLMGLMQWRGETLRVLSFDALNNEREPSNQTGSRLVIMHSVNGTPDTPRHYGLLTHGVPHLMRITPDDLERVNSSLLGPAEQMKVRVFGQAGVIPDLDYLERNAIAALNAA